MTSGLVRRGEDTENTQRRRPREDRGRDQSDVVTNTQDCGKPPETRKKRGGILSQGLRGKCGILACSWRNCERINFCCFRTLSCGVGFGGPRNPAHLFCFSWNELLACLCTHFLQCSPTALPPFPFILTRGSLLMCVPNWLKCVSSVSPGHLAVCVLIASQFA